MVLIFGVIYTDMAIQFLQYIIVYDIKHLEINFKAAEEYFLSKYG